MIFNIKHPDFCNLGYIIAVANTHDKHDRSAPTHYHWKILKCRMIIFSNSSILACPDKNDVKQVHIIFSKCGEDYDKLNSLFIKFSLVQNGAIRKTTNDIFQLCFQYTMSAKMAPSWNTLGMNYLINDRDFLISKGPQDGVRYNISCDETCLTLEINAVKINLMLTDDIFQPGEWIRVLPSLNKAVVDDFHECMPQISKFKSYKDLRRHWKNIHGYRLPEGDQNYYSVQFWRGEPLLYPKICIIRNFPIMIPVPKSAERNIVSRFVSCLSNKMPTFLGMTLIIQNLNMELIHSQQIPNEIFVETQDVSLCTPTQKSFRR